MSVIPRLRVYCLRKKTLSFSERVVRRNMSLHPDLGMGWPLYIIHNNICNIHNDLPLTRASAPCPGGVIATEIRLSAMERMRKSGVHC